MNELQELRQKIEAKDYQGALQIVNELEEMSVEDKLNKIYSYIVVLLIHLIKQAAEDRTTKSWERSIFNSIKYINRTNKRRKAGGYYAEREELKQIIDEAFEHSLKEASYEAFEGSLNVNELREKIDEELVKRKALSLLEFRD